MKANLTPSRRLILHFDINKTIVLADANKNLSKETLLMELCTYYAWGKEEFKEDGTSTGWKLYHNSFSLLQPQEGLVTYREYVESINPLRTEDDEPNEEKRFLYNKDMKEKRRDILQSFIKPQAPGIKLKPEYDRLCRLISLPKVVVEELGLAKKKDLEGNDSVIEDADYGYQKDPFLDIFREGKMQIFNSFFRMMINLKKHKREFSIVLRSFGNDLPSIITEFNKFCEGNHPLYNGRNNYPLARFDGSKGSKNYIIEERNTGVIYRYSSNIDDTSLVSGSLTRMPNREKKLEQLYKEGIENGSISIYEGSSSIYLGLLESLKDRCGYALQDDFEFWNSNGQIVECAKPLLIDPYGYDTLQIFFDDNIEENDDCIVDCRNLITTEPMLIKESINKYIVKVDTLRAITDNDYFYKLIELCEKTRQEEIDRIEKGEEEEQPQKSEWEVYQTLDDSEFLRKTVLPLIYPVKAFEIIDAERPEDPISFLAFYMMKNKHKIKLPQPPAQLPKEKDDSTNPKLEEQKT